MNPKSRRSILFDARRVSAQIKSFADERFDGYCVVGFVAGSNEPVIVKSPGDAKNQLAVNQLLVMALNLQAGPPPQEPA